MSCGTTSRRADNFLWNFDGIPTVLRLPTRRIPPWGAQADFDKQGVTDYYLDSVYHVMGEFRMDGYRQDAVMAMTDSGWTAQWNSGQNLMRADEPYSSIVVTQTRRPSRRSTSIPTGSSPASSSIPSTTTASRTPSVMRSLVHRSGVQTSLGTAAALDGTGSVSGTEVFNYFELHDDAWPLNGHERAVRVIDTSFPQTMMIFARGRTTTGATRSRS